MASRILNETLHIGGMTCVNCQNRIEKKLKSTAGIIYAQVNYNAGSANITYNADKITRGSIATIIRKLDYEVFTGSPAAPKSNYSRGIGAILIIVALYVLMEQFGFTRLFTDFQLAEAGMGYGMLFVIGLVTSVHCVAMCGGINMSQCIPSTAPRSDDSKTAALWPSFLYNLGRVISYTVIGGIVGAIGGVISPSGMFRGIVQIAAGVFMVIMGINMLGIFPGLRRFVPRMPRIFASKIDAEKGRSKGPLYIGLLNGLMPCGPLQAMQFYALSTGNPVQGALSMMLFSLGTVPLMFGLGALSSILSKKFTKKMMTVGAVLVAVLGLSMFSQGMSLSGVSSFPFVQTGSNEGASSNRQSVVVENGIQMVSSSLLPGQYPAITVQAGMPVRWTIDAPDGSINGCNNRFFIDEYGIEHTFQPGENIIEFTPGEAGTYQYSCWMGMIRSTITVVDESGSAPVVAADESDVQNPFEA